MIQLYIYVYLVFPRGSVGKEVCLQCRLRGKAQVCVNRHKGRHRREFLSLCPHGSFNYFYGAFLLGILWANHSGVCGSQSLLVYLRILPHVYASLSQDGFYWKGVWAEKASLNLIPLSAWKEPCSMHVWCREIWLLQEAQIRGLGRAKPPPLICLPVILWSLNQ